MSPESRSKEKEKPVCFVIMPISDVPGYDAGHFGRVYEHLLKPAIVEAGYMPVRADDTNKTDYIVVGVVQKVVDSAIVLCDYSARNPNVLYELGIRHAFNRPVVLVKDTRTEKVFDIQGLRYTEYDPSLRVDTVQKDISRISNAIKETAGNDEDAYNSVVHLAGLSAAQVPEKQTISPDTHVLLSAIANLENRIENLNSRTKSPQRFITFEGDQIKFSDGSDAKIGEEINDGKNYPLGTLVDFHPSEEQIFIQLRDGKVVPYSASSIKSKSLSTYPF
jgi:hypothetical protein